MNAMYFVNQVARDLGIEKDFATQNHPGGVIIEDGNGEDKFLVTIDSDEENIGVIQVAGRVPKGQSLGTGILRIYGITSLMCELCGWEEQFLRDRDVMTDSDWCPDAWWTEKSGGFNVCPTCHENFFNSKDGTALFSLDKLEENYPDFFKEIVNTISKRIRSIRSRKNTSN